MNNPLRVSLSVTALAAALFSAGALSAPTFESLDTDKSGFLDIKEAEGMKSLPKVFPYMDKNENQKLEPEEYAYVRIGGEDNKRVPEGSGYSE